MLEAWSNLSTVTPVYDPAARLWFLDEDQDITAPTIEELQAKVDAPLEGYRPAAGVMIPKRAIVAVEIAHNDFKRLRAQEPPGTKVRRRSGISLRSPSTPRGKPRRTGPWLEAPKPELPSTPADALAAQLVPAQKSGERPRVVDWAEIVELRIQGLTYRAIAKKVGCAQSTVKNVMAKTKEAARVSNVPWTAPNRVILPKTQIWPEERTARLIEMLRNGMSCAAVAAELGITRNAVIGKAHRLGMRQG